MLPLFIHILFPSSSCMWVFHATFVEREEHEEEKPNIESEWEI